MRTGGGSGGGGIRQREPPPPSSAFSSPSLSLFFFSHRQPISCPPAILFAVDTESLEMTYSKPTLSSRTGPDIRSVRTERTDLACLLYIRREKEGKSVKFLATKPFNLLSNKLSPPINLNSWITMYSIDRNRKETTVFRPFFSFLSFFFFF